MSSNLEILFLFLLQFQSHGQSGSHSLSFTSSGNYPPDCRVISYSAGVCFSFESIPGQDKRKVAKHQEVERLPEDGERILKVTKKSGNRGRCRKLCL